MRYLSVVAAAALILAVTGTAGAITVIGDPFDSESWGQRFQENGVGLYNQMRIKMLSAGDAFEPPDFRNFSKSGWLCTSSLADTATAAGPAVTDMQFDIYFKDAKSNPLSFLFQAFNGSTRLESTTASWSGSGWSFAPNVGAPDIPVIPEPVTILGLLVSVGAVGGYLRRRRVA